MDNMLHLNHLAAVLASDEAVLRAKEATYQGSWKAAGGRSAWFMARRNLDRLLVMMRDVDWPESASIGDLDEVSQGRMPEAYMTPELAGFLARKLRAEDIFAMIEADPSGADGTVLAVLRDARRYFTLVEAEMIARGVVVPEGWSKPSYDELVNPAHVSERTEDLRFREATKHICTVCSEEVKDPMKRWLVKLGEGKSETRCERHRSPVPVETYKRMEDAVPGTPEDGGHHETQAKIRWEVSPAWARQHLGEELYKLLYVEWSRERAFLTPSLEFKEYERLAEEPKIVELGLAYLSSGSRYVLDVGRAPEALRPQWPSFDLEVNHYELNRLPQWARDLYRWTDGEDKYVIAQLHRAWAKK